MTLARTINLNLSLAILILLIILFLILLHVVSLSTAVTIVARQKEMQLIHVLVTLDPHGINERFTFC